MHPLAAGRQCCGFWRKARRDEPGRNGTLQHANQISLAHGDCNFQPVKVMPCSVPSLFFSLLMRDSSRAINFQCSATFSYALFMNGSVACAARCLASSAFCRQVSLSDDIRGGSSNAPNQPAGAALANG